MRVKSQDFTCNYLFFLLENKYKIHLIPDFFQNDLKMNINVTKITAGIVKSTESHEKDCGKTPTLL